MFALSALAVDKEIVGKDSEGELICWEGELRRDCCWAAAAARRAEVAVWTSVFDLGEVEKNWASLFPLEVDGLRGKSRFSSRAEEFKATVVGQVLANGFIDLRCIVDRLVENRARTVKVRINRRF